MAKKKTRTFINQMYKKPSPKVKENDTVQSINDYIDLINSVSGKYGYKTNLVSGSICNEIIKVTVYISGKTNSRREDFQCRVGRNYKVEKELVGGYFYLTTL